MADLLFDIGNVLLSFNFEKSLSRLLPSSHPNPKAALERLLEKKDPLEAGKISEEEYISWALDVLESTASHEEFRAAWRDIFTPNQPMWACAEKLSNAGHRLILFSNINSIHAPWIFEEFPQFSIFHEAVLSFQVGAIKPDPAIYLHAIQSFNLRPDSTYYIDDLAQNIQTGKDLGLLCHRYDRSNHAAFDAWLTQQSLY